MRIAVEEVNLTDWDSSSDQLMRRSESRWTRASAAVTETEWQQGQSIFSPYLIEQMSRLKEKESQTWLESVILLFFIALWRMKKREKGRPKGKGKWEKGENVWLEMKISG